MSDDVRHDGETWESYAKRLERRVKEQRDHLDQHNVLRKAEGLNRADRKRVASLERTLGQMTLRWEKERDAKLALVAKLRASPEGGALPADLPVGEPQ